MPKKPTHQPEPDDAAGFDLVEEEPQARPKPAKPKKKKKFKRRIPAEEDDSHASSLRHFEWIAPSIVLAIGIVLTFVGAIGATKGGATGAMGTVAVVFVGLLLSIPLTIGALMVAGVLLGVEYGRFGPAVLKLAAITFVANGVLWIGDWAKLPPMLTFPVSCVISFGLFMTLFDLDTWETNASLAVVNGLTFVFHFVIAMFLVTAEAKREQKRGPDDDSPPANVRPGPKGRPGPQMDPDDDGPDDPEG